MDRPGSIRTLWDVRGMQEQVREGWDEPLGLDLEPGGHPSNLSNRRPSLQAVLKTSSGTGGLLG